MINYYFDYANLVDANVIKNKETAANTNSLLRLDMENDDIIADKIINNSTSNNDEQSEMELSESDLQLQVRKMNVIIRRLSRNYKFYFIVILSFV